LQEVVTAGNTGVRDPRRVWDAFVAFGPHPAEFGGKAEGKVAGVEAVELEQDDRAGARAGLIGREHDLAEGEAHMRVSDDGAFGVYIHLGSQFIHVDGDTIALDLHFNGEVGEELDGEHPRFKGAVLLAEENAPLARDGKWLDGLGMGPDDGTGVVKPEGRDGIEGLCVDCGNYGNKQAQGRAERDEFVAHGVVL
jgi:hypothetical protein